MKKILLLTLLLPMLLRAQLDGVYVERYYVSDENDATDTTGGYLQPGSVTYRVFVHLAPGVKLRKLYGDANHPLRFSSTEFFFNNLADGQTFAKDISKNRYGENTVALDTWLTLGQCTKTSSVTYGALPKHMDTNGSFIGGDKNDGGSAEVPGGLLTNNHPEVGIPLTQADGFDTLFQTPTNWAHFGFLDAITSEDSTIFGSLKPDSVFETYNAALQHSGVMGLRSDSNVVLIAQLTTAGKLAFEINIEVIDTNGAVIKYVANDDTLLTGERVSSALRYPPACGCTNPDFLEYSASFACSEDDSCRTPIIFGCTDSLACNYNPSATFPIPTLCCYPGWCNNLDVSLVCPWLGVGAKDESMAIVLYPNPAQSKLHLLLPVNSPSDFSVQILNGVGAVATNNHYQSMPAGSTVELDISNLAAGLYFLRLSAGNNGSTLTKFIKEQ